MTDPLILASGSGTRAALLRAAGVPFETSVARLDEQAIRTAMSAEGESPRAIADALAEAKARKVASRFPDRLVLGCDQVLAEGGEIFGKPASPGAAIAQLERLRGRRHILLSAAVIYDAARPVWRHVSEVRMTMRHASDAYIRDYVGRNWDSIRHSAGGYRIEEEGVRLFQRIEGDHFAILGLPLMEVLDYLTVRGVLPG